MIVSDTHIILGIQSPKKDATVGTGAFTIGVDEVAIRVGANLPVTRPGIYIGYFEKILRWVMTNIKDHTDTRTFAITIGGSDNDIVLGHAAARVSMTIHSSVLGKDKSHHINRTVKLLMDRWLEEGKSNG